MLVETMRMDVASNNLANVDTAGFQRQTAHIYATPQRPVLRVHQGQSRMLGALGTGALVEGSHTSFMPGTLRQTDNPLDVALVGAGFFAITTPEGPRYTRDGRFTVNPSGLLATLDGNLVRGENGPIYVGEGPVSITDTGQVMVGGQVVDKLLIVEFNDRNGLVRRGTNLFEATPEAGDFPLPGGIGTRHDRAGQCECGQRNEPDQHPAGLRGRQRRLCRPSMRRSARLSTRYNHLHPAERYEGRQEADWK